MYWHVNPVQRIGKIFVHLQLNLYETVEKKSTNVDEWVIFLCDKEVIMSHLKNFVLQLHLTSQHVLAQMDSFIICMKIVCKQPSRLYKGLKQTLTFSFIHRKEVPMCSYLTDA